MSATMKTGRTAGRITDMTRDSLKPMRQYKGRVPFDYAPALASSDSESKSPHERSSDSRMGAELTVRLGALAANYAEVRRRASSALAFPVVKANAYSLGV